MRFCCDGLSAAKMTDQVIDRSGCSIRAAVRMPRGILPAGGGKRRVWGTGGFGVLECSLLGHGQRKETAPSFAAIGRPQVYATIECGAVG